MPADHGERNDRVAESQQAPAIIERIRPGEASIRATSIAAAGRIGRM